MKKFISSTLLLCAFFTTFSQNINLNGKVKDSIGTGLEMANIIALNAQTKALESYCVTNHNGEYKLTLKANTTYNIKVSFLGCTPGEFTISTTETDLSKDITLMEENSLLSEVDVTYKMPVSVRGDTIVYNTDSFTTGTEKKLKDVLVALPGVELNDDGQIEVEGKKVQKIMVEGKDFFDGDTKIATENIPADAIDKVEVLRNYNEVNQMQGLTNDTDNIAMNIKLKKGKKNFWFGELTAGAGPDEKFLAHPKLFYYSPKFSLNLITDMNNIGEVPFTRRDYMNFTGGFKNFNRNGSSSFSTGSNSLGISTAQNDKAKNIDTKFAALNFSYSPSKTLDISGFGIYAYTDTEMRTESSITYKLDNNRSKVEEAIKENDQDVNLGLIKFSSVFKPNANFQFDYDIMLKQSNDEEVESVSSLVDNTTDLIIQNKKQKPISINQNTNIYYTLNDRNIFTFEAQHLYQNEDPFYNSVRNEFAFVDLFPVNQSQSLYNLNQKKNILTNKVDAKVDYYYITGDKSNIQLTLGTTQSHQNFDSDIFQILDDKSKLAMEGDSFENDVNFNISDLFLGFHYKLQTGIFTFNPGLSLHQYKTDNKQLGSHLTDELTSILPDMYINVQLKKSENLRFNYKITRAFTDVSKFAQSYVLNNYNSVYSGNRDLESSLNHNISLNFFSFNMFNFTHMFANLNYTKRIDALKSDVIPMGTNQITSTINSNLEDESLSANARYQRTFKNFKLSTRANLSWAKTNNLINSLPSTSESFSQNYSGSVSTNFKKAPNLELGYSYSVSNYDRGQTSTSYFTKRPYVKLDAIILKELILTADYNFYSYTNKENTIDNEYSFLEANLLYQKKDSQWEFGLKGKNLLDTKSLNQSSETDYAYASSTYYVQPRYFLFTVKYNL
ncbi:carboxypeptidase-like regulatory domain-containing protein [Ancylomarina euxinus]|uniref:carboxypeptidase-like regulatory domain-containing protein n=1 Tax=Ancylomarina euxinus TaxID=2283627 RepID=UPI0012E2C72C|nr:carboxypeptidase-like regulatory domain-containing protein [Ancylomarina euxinus]MCZ4695995.1 carboxypeptidase-like regulatory domain-containing protein [Ancylomarina euxinus]